MAKTFDINELIIRAVENDGGTFSLIGDKTNIGKHCFQEKKMPKGGYIVANKNSIENVPVLRPIYIEDFIRYSMVGHHIGLWYDNGNAVWSIDEPRWIVRFDAAVTFARANNQKAIWDIENNKELRIV